MNDVKSKCLGDVDMLIARMQSGFCPKWMFFWGHNPKLNGNLSGACFSQWWSAHPFVLDEVLYPTAEHWMMSEKARLFQDVASLEKIQKAKTASQAKQFGRTVAGFDELKWRASRFDIVVKGNLAKFSQHPDLKQFLLQTGNRVLVEASPVDRIWGIGLAADDPDAEKPKRWKGLNLLGFALMEVRDQMSNRISDEQ